MLGPARKNDEIYRKNETLTVGRIWDGKKLKDRGRDENGYLAPHSESYEVHPVWVEGSRRSLCQTRQARTFNQLDVEQSLSKIAVLTLACGGSGMWVTPCGRTSRA